MLVLTRVSPPTRILRSRVCTILQVCEDLLEKMAKESQNEKKLELVTRFIAPLGKESNFPLMRLLLPEVWWDMFVDLVLFAEDDILGEERSRRERLAPCLGRVLRSRAYGLRIGSPPIDFFFMMIGMSLHAKRTTHCCFSKEIGGVVGDEARASEQ